MIAAWLARLALPTWLVELIGIAALLTGLVLGFQWYQHHLIAQGVAQESARRDAIDRQRDAQAKAELAILNARVHDAQALLTAAQADVQRLENEVQHEKAVSSQRQADLLAGRERLRVLIRTAGGDAAPGPAQAGTAGAVDSAGSTATATLDGRVASDLEWARQTRNEAILAARACVEKYDALSQAVDKTGQQPARIVATPTQEREEAHD